MARAGTTAAAYQLGPTPGRERPRGGAATAAAATAAEAQAGAGGARGDAITGRP
jgi:hypothetical protein